MGWSIGYDTSWKRDIGYGVPAYCDHPDCNAEIDRGLSYVCCSEQPYGGDDGCGLYFCGKHQDWKGRCERCAVADDLDEGAELPPPFDAKPDHPTWIKHKLTDASWGAWRADHRKEVAAMRDALSRPTPDTPAVPVPPPLDLQAWERLARAATPGPWEAIDYNDEHPERETWLGLLQGAVEIVDERFQLARVKYSALPKEQNVANLAFIASCSPERILGLIAAAQANQRIVDLVCAEGTVVETSKINRGMVVVVDGRTGLDACERSAAACFDALFAEADGGESPGRISLTFKRAASPESSDHA